MTRNRKKRRQRWDDDRMSVFKFISEETVNGILGVLSVVLAIFLLLAAFGLAGKAGHLVYEWLSYFFGIGYYLLPTVFLLLAISFLQERERNFAMPQIFGSLLFFLSSLGLVDLLSTEGGLVGNFISK